MGVVKHVIALFAALSIGALGAACTSPRDSGPATPLLLEKGNEQALYDADERLQRLVQDADGDRRADVIRFYAPDGHLQRREVDVDRDGALDRWESLDLRGKVSRVGLCRRGEPRPDLWIGYDDRGQENRREYDDDGDGRPERAEVLAEGRVVAEELSTRGDGRFDRRLVRGPDGSIVRVETDANGDGLFERSLPARP
jgi:hypothetical protein